MIESVSSAQSVASVHHATKNHLVLVISAVLETPYMRGLAFSREGETI